MNNAHVYMHRNKNKNFILKTYQKSMHLSMHLQFVYTVNFKTIALRLVYTGRRRSQLLQVLELGCSEKQINMNKKQKLLG